MPRSRRRGGSLLSLATALACLPSALSAEPVSLHAAVGRVWPEALPAGWWIAAGAGIPLWRVSVEPEIGYWSRSETAFGLQASVRDLHAGLAVRWEPARIGPAALFVGGGGAAHFVRNSGGPIAGPTAAESAVRPGALAFLGIETRLGRARLFAGFRSDWIRGREGARERESRVYGGVRLPL